MIAEQYPERWAAANRWSNDLPRRGERRYAGGILTWLRGGAVGHEPVRGRLTVARAGLIREHLYAMNLWGDSV